MLTPLLPNKSPYQLHFNRELDYHLRILDVHAILVSDHMQQTSWILYLKGAFFLAIVHSILDIAAFPYPPANYILAEM